MIRGTIKNLWTTSLIESDNNFHTVFNKLYGNIYIYRISIFPFTFKRYRHFINGAHRARISSTYVVALCSFVRFMHIRKAHSAYKCTPGLSERRRLERRREGAITSIETFFAVAVPFASVFIYLYTRCFVFICRHLSSRRNALEDYKARKIFSSHDRHNSSAARFAPFLTPSLRTDERTTVGVSPVPGRKTERDSYSLNTSICICLAPCVDADKRIY